MADPIDTKNDLEELIGSGNERINSSKESEVLSRDNYFKESEARWINNKGENVEEVFGFNENAELVNGRAAMLGFLMLILTEFIFNGVPASKSIFGIG